MPPIAIISAFAFEAERTIGIEYSRTLLHAVWAAGFRNLDCQIPSASGHKIILQGRAGRLLRLATGPIKTPWTRSVRHDVDSRSAAPLFQNMLCQVGTEPTCRCPQDWGLVLEFEQAPAEWRRTAQSLDELWAPSRFVVKRLEGEAPKYPSRSCLREWSLGRSFLSIGLVSGTTRSYALSLHLRCEQPDRSKESQRRDRSLSPSLPVR